MESQLAELHLEGSAQKDWESFRDIVYTTAEQLLGYPIRNQQDWFEENDDEIQALLAEKHRLHRAYQGDPSSAAKKSAFTSVRRCVKSKLRKMQDSWLSAKAEEIQAYVDRPKTQSGSIKLSMLFMVLGLQEPHLL